MNIYAYDVTVLVATYNPNKEKLFRTLKSIFVQKKVNIQVVLVDDGSKDFPYQDIVEYFEAYEFCNYNIVSNNNNQGTVKNLKSGIDFCKGKYVKLISPGDCLYGEEVLYRWFDFMENEGVAWSFGDAIYYSTYANNNVTILRELANPQDIKCYITKNNANCIRNYLISGDLVLGSSTICNISILKKYLEIIMDKVIYAEDNIYRLMMFDGVSFAYFSETVILYEFGSGISTSKNEEWSRKIHLDWINTNDIIKRNSEDVNKIKNDFEIVEKEFSNKIFKHLRCLFVKGYILKKIKFRLAKRYTIDKVNQPYLEKLGLFL